MVTVNAIEHEDVRGKKLKYLKITNGKVNLLVNVGDKTYEGVKNMETAKEETKKEEAEKGGKKK